MPTWRVMNRTLGELKTFRRHPPYVTHAPRRRRFLELPSHPPWARTSWITGVAGQVLPAPHHPWTTDLLCAAPPAGRRGGQASPVVWVTAVQPTAQRRSSTVWPASSLRARLGDAPTLRLPPPEALCPARYKFTTPTTMVPVLHRLSHASPAQPGPVPLSHRSATAAVTAASRPSLTGTTTSSRIAQYARCRPAIGATHKTGSVNQGGSSSVQMAGHTAPPRTLCSYFSSQDPDPKGSHTGPTETTLPLTILEHALKICSPSTTTMVAR